MTQLRAHADGGKPSAPAMDKSLITADGTYAWFRHGIGCPSVNRRPALFLDRDGVIVEEVCYLHRAQDVRLIEGAASETALFNRAGVAVVVATNQAGIARGYFGWPEFYAVEQEISRALAGFGAHLDAVLACPFHEKGDGPYKAVNHLFRKPNPGMLTYAAQIMGLDLCTSWLVGDKLSDIEAALRGGLRGAVHVMSGHGPDHLEAVRRLERENPSFCIRYAGSIKGVFDLLGQCLIDNKNHFGESNAR